MKGILQNRREWIRLGDSSNLDYNDLTIQNGDEKLSYSDLKDEKLKLEVRRKYEVEINTLYRALNGEVRPNTTIRKYIQNVLNAETFSSICCLLTGS